MSKSILEEQKAYYSARAREYDEWWNREGRYDRGDQHRAQWLSEADIIRQLLKRLQQQGTYQNVLEMACGTGIWTQNLALYFDKVHAVDASPEMLAINRHKLALPNVTYQQADLFEWNPDQTYDLVFFGFWLSHVPPERLPDFLQTVARALRPGGRVVMLDSQRDPQTIAIDHQLPEDTQAQTLTRKLNDGQEYTIYKIFYQPADLIEAFTAAGFECEAANTRQFFVYANALKP